MRLSLSNSLYSFLITPTFFLSISGFSASPQGAHGRLDHHNWLEISNPWTAINDNGWHGCFSISSRCHANVCAPGSTSGCTWRSCEGSPTTLLPLQGFLSLSLSLSLPLFHALSLCLFFSIGLLFCCPSRDERDSGKGASCVKITCLARSVISPHMAAQLMPHTLAWKKLRFACWKNSNQRWHYSFLKFITFF